MANCHDLFIQFNDNLNILESKLSDLLESRRALRKTIKNYFSKEHKEYKPLFTTQGSYVLGTIIRTKEDSCDLDDGVYFDKKPEGSSAILQGWIHDAVKDQTDGGSKQKNKCVRVFYKANYHIDIPVYYKIEELQNPELATRYNGYKKSDPKEFIDWFKNSPNKCDQLDRTIKYLKAWCDKEPKRMLTGLAITVLAEELFVSNDQDDLALSNLLHALHDRLLNRWTCIMPTAPADDLLEKYDQVFKDNFLESLRVFKIDAKSAIDETDKSRACKKWKKHLGKYFDDCEELEEEKRAHNSTFIIGSAKESKPWLNE